LPPSSPASGAHAAFVDEAAAVKAEAAALRAELAAVKAAAAAERAAHHQRVSVTVRYWGFLFVSGGGFAQALAANI
jgi:hypothetical protein